MSVSTQYSEGSFCLKYVPVKPTQPKPTSVSSKEINKLKRILNFVMATKSVPVQMLETCIRIVNKVI